MKKILLAECLSLGSVFQGGAHKYVEHFLQNDYQVFWLSPYISPFHFLKIFGTKYTEVPERIKLWKNNGEEVKPNLITYAPFTFLPYSKYIFDSLFFVKPSLKLTMPSLKKILAQWKFDTVDILWNDSPRMLNLKDMVSHKVFVYWYSDDTTAFSSYPMSQRSLVERVIKESDFVFATALKLFEDAKRLNPNTYYIPNGVDYELFSKKAGNLPNEFIRIPPPRIVYMGTIDKWFDLDLISYAAAILSEYSFVIIGSNRVDTSPLRKLKNVHLVGPVKHLSLPSYLQNSDVGIIPFKKNQLTDSVNPIKLYEYFAAGLPVVSVNLEEVRNIQSPAILADSYESFVEGLKIAYHAGKNKNDYEEFAKNNSWSSRFSKIVSIIHPYL